MTQKEPNSPDASRSGLKLGLFSYSYRLAFGSHDFSPSAPMDLFAYMDRARAYGFDGIQIDLTHLESREADYLERVRTHAAEAGLFVEYGSTGVDADRITGELATCRALGATLMRTYMGFSRYDRRTDVAEETANAIAVLREAGLRVQDEGMRIALENHCDATTEELLHVVESVGRSSVGVCVDLGNFMINLENPVASVRQLAPHIINTHFKDYAMEMMNWGFKSYGVPLGEGMIDLRAILEILINESKLDRIMLEIVSEPQGDEESVLRKEDRFVQQSVAFARNELCIR